MLKDPFDLYLTYLHVDDWNTYMQNLGQGMAHTSIRKSDMEKASSLLSKLLSKVAEDDTTMERNMSIEDNKQNHKTTKKKGKGKSDKNQRKRWDSAQHMLINRKAEGCTATIDFNLSAKKIQDAIGKRQGEQSQGAVMGGVTAPSVNLRLK